MFNRNSIIQRKFIVKIIVNLSKLKDPNYLYIFIRLFLTFLTIKEKIQSYKKKEFKFINSIYLKPIS